MQLTTMLPLPFLLPFLFLVPSATPQMIQGSCSTPGQITCTGPTTWSTCLPNNQLIAMGSVADGMVCQNGNIVSKDSVSVAAEIAAADDAAQDVELLRDVFTLLMSGQLDTSTEQVVFTGRNMSMTIGPTTVGNVTFEKAAAVGAVQRRSRMAGYKRRGYGSSCIRLYILGRRVNIGC